MIITISGSPGSGKSDISRMLAAKLGIPHYSAGGFHREMAKEKGLTILEHNKLIEKDKKTDEEVDKRTKELAKREGDFVIDCRLGFHFIPNSIKIFLDVSEKEAAKRIFNAMRPDERENSSLEKTLENMRRRTKSEKLRYKKYYNLDHFDKSHYDFVLDTTNLTKEQVLARVLKFVKSRIKK